MIPINLIKSASSTNNAGFCFLAALYASQHIRNIIIKVRVIIVIACNINFRIFHSSDRTKFLFFASSSIFVSIPFQISNIAALYTSLSIRKSIHIS